MIEDYSYQKSRLNIKKDYQRKEFVNPYFSHKKKTGYFNTRLYLKILLALFLIYLIVYSSLLKVRDINVQGIDLINEQEFISLINRNISGYYLFILPKKNLLFLNKKDLTEAINSHYSLNSLQIKKSWNALNLKIEEKISSLIVYNNKEYYFTDAAGTITRQIAGEESAKYLSRFPLILTVQQINIGYEFASARIVGFIIELDNKLKEQKYRIKGYELGGVNEVYFDSAEGWQAKFDINSDLQQALDNMNLILKEKIKDRKLLNYIDLRAGDKVFYKLK